MKRDPNLWDIACDFLELIWSGIAIGLLIAALTLALVSYFTDKPNPCESCLKNPSIGYSCKYKPAWQVEAEKEGWKKSE